MALYKYLREAWDNGELLKERLIQWRDEPVTVRLRRPTRLDRARSLGYKAKPGFIIVRQRVQRSRRMHPRRMMGGRRPKASSQRKDLNKRYGQIAEERASRKIGIIDVNKAIVKFDDFSFKDEEELKEDDGKFLEFIRKNTLTAKF